VVPFILGTESCRSGVHVSLGSFLREPLRGKTSLSKIFWFYGVLGSLVSAVGLAVDAGNEFAMRVYMVFGLLFSLYVTVATYQCASNCQSKFLAGEVEVNNAGKSTLAEGLVSQWHVVAEY
jgi:succinate-acetate transporter protein